MHRRMVRGKANRSGIVLDVAEGKRHTVMDQCAEQSMPLWKWADPGDHIGIHSGSNELEKSSIGIGDANRGVPGGHDSAGNIRKSLQDTIEAILGSDGERCLIRQEQRIVGVAVDDALLDALLGELPSGLPHLVTIRMTRLLVRSIS